MMSPAPVVTPIPMKILADAKAAATPEEEKSYKSQTTNTILNWLKNTTTPTKPTTPGTKSQYNNKEINTCQQHNLLEKQRSVKDTSTAKGLATSCGNCACASAVADPCTCLLLKQLNNTHYDTYSSNSTFPLSCLSPNYYSCTNSGAQSDKPLIEFRGVQRLKHFWNKRITASKESPLNAKSSKSQKVFTNSQSCLVTTSNQAGELPPRHLATHSRRPFASLERRAQSLHDCSQVFEERSALNDLEIQKHLEKDNFYKFKTAEQALKLRELSETSASRRLSGGIILPLVQGFHNGERWLIKRKSSYASSPYVALNRETEILAYKENLSANDNDKATSDMPSPSDIIINDTYHPTTSSSPRASCQSVANETESSPTLTVANFSQRSSSKISPKRKRSLRENGVKVNNDVTTVVSGNSSSTSSAHSSSGGGKSSRSASVKRNSTARKYSFKTHARSYHASRKMHNQKDTANASTPAHNASNSLVAKLTKQFNEFVQHDKGLLQEVKRKNGVFMTHRGHVYKIVEKNKPSGPSSTLRITAWPSHNPSESGDVAKESKTPTDMPSAVQETIKIFETASRSCNKPKVPSKSLKVLEKSNELVINKTGKLRYPVVRSVAANSIDFERKCPPEGLIIPNALEMVMEESKTPLETNGEERTSKLDNKEETNNANDPENSKVATPSEVNSAISERENIHNLNVRLYSVGKVEEPLDTKRMTDEQTDPFFEEIIKDPRRNEDDVLGYKSIAKKSQINRCTSIIVDEPQKNLLIYINDKAETRASLTTQLYGDSTNSIKQDNSSTKLLKAKDNFYSRPTPTMELAKEFARELNEKFYSDPKFSFVAKRNETSVEKSSCKELNIEECKEVDESSNEMNCQAADYSSAIKDNKLEREKLTKELKNRTNKEKVLEQVKSENYKEDIYQEIQTPSQSSETRKSKTKHSKFYEKIKYFTMSRKNQKGGQIADTSKPDDVLQMSDTQSTSTSAISSDLQPYTPMSSPLPQQRETCSTLVHYSLMCDPDSKLLDALQQVDEKLHNLSMPLERVAVAVENLLESDEYGHHIQPNTSFLHHSYTKDATSKPATLNQAVNVTLVNAIEGEQMIMEQKEIQQKETEVETTENNTSEKSEESLSKESTLKTPSNNDEPLYEPIGFVEIEQDVQPLKTEPINNTRLTTNYSIEDDIYQTVEEVVIKKHQESPTSRKVEVSISAPPSPPQCLLADYEIISESNAHAPTLNYQISISKGYDGYEEYSATPPHSINTLTATSSPSSAAIRKTTDELPDLPKPKRTLPKSPMSKRAITKTPTPTASENYAGDEEENIYDTIKGSHCYESLQSMSNELQKSVLACTKNSDSLSINSNCYESISHFKPFRGVTSHHSGSSHGSTITLSSENKTNSLYEDSFGSILLPNSSKRTYRSNTESQIGMEQQRTLENNGNANCNTSIGLASDTSDEWTDVTDNDQGDEEGQEQKPQFIIVRSKAHKSPDWSRRVRDRRLHHQRQAKSFVQDDDPDHYYEQLSPSALNKRHSLGIQQRTGSLQRNQEVVRVSKRGKQISYSAHALGQEISDDSFDLDTDDYYETENFKNSANDSGVDIRTTKLPDPPTSSNQMYAFVRKFKNFIGGNKKLPNSSRHGVSQSKMDDTSSQFYVSGNIYSPGNGGSSGSDGVTGNIKSSLQGPQTKELSTSEKNLIMAQSQVTKVDQFNASATSRKSKAGKSLRSRLRKSLVGFDNKQLPTLTPTRSTFYVEEPCNTEDNNGQLDSGFSEKAYSGDIPHSTHADTTVPSPAVAHKCTTLSRKAKKESKPSNAHRRRTTIGIRPIEPPPPPPDNGITSGTKRQSNTSWYAECGVFKNGSTNLVTDDTQLLKGQNGSGNSNSGASWYEEAGLYQTSGVSVASSSGSSGVSTSNEAGPSDDMSHSMFSNEPLYQIYSAAKLEAISRDMHEEDSTDGYEEVGEHGRSILAQGESQRKLARQTALELVEKERGPARTLWSQITEVVNSLILPTMTPRERALMEAKFEVITSEASYLKSLNLLRNHFMNHPVFRDVNLVNSRDRKSLFAHIMPVHDCSERLLTELESCWQDNIMLIGLSKRIYAIAEKYFHVYVTFCEQQGRMDRTLKRLRSAKGLFAQNLELLESSDTCYGLNLHSFLMLPMQRITRLPLLIDAVFSKCNPNDDEYENWKMCLAIINKIVGQCNEAATKSDQAFEIEKISRQLEFNSSVIRPLAIAPVGVLAPGTKPRFLVKKGEFTHLIWRGDDAKLTFGKKFSKNPIYAFLFSDLLVLTKRKGDEQFSVFDYCPRNMLTITSGDTLPQLPTKDLNSQTSKNLILMTLLENHERKTNELLLSCPSVSEQERWLQAMRPPESETPGEKLYEQWDCPQVMANHAYENNEPDGLNLEVGDVVNVTRKLPDGWYQGERIRDGAVGWFPGSFTEEVNSAHVRARNLKLRHRLLTFTATYLESQKRNK